VHGTIALQPCTPLPTTLCVLCDRLKSSLYERSIDWINFNHWKFLLRDLGQRGIQLHPTRVEQWNGCKEGMACMMFGNGCLCMNCVCGVVTCWSTLRNLPDSSLAIATNPTPPLAVSSSPSNAARCSLSSHRHNKWRYHPDDADRPCQPAHVTNNGDTTIINTQTPIEREDARWCSDCHGLLRCFRTCTGWSFPTPSPPRESFRSLTRRRPCRG
jgi:hypothetical protein